MGFYPQYSDAARRKCDHSKHAHHYDSGWKLLCDNCGEILSEGKRKSMHPVSEAQKNIKNQMTGILIGKKKEKV